MTHLIMYYRLKKYWQLTHFPLFSFADNGLWLRQTGQRPDLDAVRHARVPGPRNHPQQGAQGKSQGLTVEMKWVNETSDPMPHGFTQFHPQIRFPLIAGLQQGGRLVGPGRAHLRDGCRLPALLRRPAHPDLREDRVRQGRIHCTISSDDQPQF
jgi:hypothetical protein